MANIREFLEKTQYLMNTNTLYLLITLHRLNTILDGNKVVMVLDIYLYINPTQVENTILNSNIIVMVQDIYLY